MWTEIYLSFVDALKKQSVNQWLLQRTRMRQELETEYKKLGDISAFADWLKAKADAEKYGVDEGIALFTIGGI